MKIIHEKGFTLIEVLIAMAVFAILASMAAPAFNTMMINQNLNKSTRELAFVLSDARAKAALERREIKVQLNSAIANTNTQMNWKPTGKSTLKSGAPTSITFSPTGLIKNTTTDTTFEICAISTGTLSKIVTISRMGTVQSIKEGTC